MILIYSIGKKLYGNLFGWLWVLAYAGSFLPHFYFKSGIIDPWFNLFIFCGIYYFILFTNFEKTKHFSFSAFFIGLAILTKGPVALLIFGLCAFVYYLLKRFHFKLSVKQILLFLTVVLITGGFWFLLQAINGNFNVIVDFFNYQVRLLKTEDAGHGGPFYYHALVLLIGCFPASIFALRGFKKGLRDTPYQQHFKKIMIILFLVVLVLFSIVKTKIVHYSSLCYFPLTFLAAYSIYKLIIHEMVWKKWMSYTIGFIGVLIGIVLILPPFIDKFKERIIASDLIKDPFAVENLKANVYWSGLESLIGILFIISIVISLIIIRKKEFKTGIIFLFSASLFTIILSSLFIVPKVEGYSQAAAIEFYESIKDENCYIETLGFKSYAHLFYSEKKPVTNEKGYDPSWLLSGEIDKPAYFVCKIQMAEEIKLQYPLLKELYRKNGFVFFNRKPI